MLRRFKTNRFKIVDHFLNLFNICKIIYLKINKFLHLSNKIVCMIKIGNEVWGIEVLLDFFLTLIFISYLCLFWIFFISFKFKNLKILIYDFLYFWELFQFPTCNFSKQFVHKNRFVFVLKDYFRLIILHGNFNNILALTK